MDEQLQPELNTEPKPTMVDETKKEEKVGSVFNFENMIRSEREVNAFAASVASTESIVKHTVEDKVFSKKVDRKKQLYRTRVKIVTSIYTTVVALLLILTGANIVSLIVTAKAINNDKQIVQTNQEKIVELEQESTATTGQGKEIYVTLNQPRDYSKEKTDLTFLDKVTILIKNIFG